MKNRIVKIKALKIKLGSVDLELTLKEAEELYDALGKLFEIKEVVKVKEIYPYPYVWYYPYIVGPVEYADKYRVWCDNTSQTLTISSNEIGYNNE